ncbi:hypothetical protein ACW5CM_05945 [Microbacterium sp. A588]
MAMLTAPREILSSSAGDLLRRSATRTTLRDNVPRTDRGEKDECVLTSRKEERPQTIRSSCAPGVGRRGRHTGNSESEYLHVLSEAVSVLITGDSLTFDGRESHQWHAGLEQDAELH